MKKMIWVGLFLFCFSGLAYAADRIPEENCGIKCSYQVVQRGVVNFVTLPAEIVSVAKREYVQHPKAFPLTYIPRLVYHSFVRAFSSCYDVFIYPWVAASSEEIPTSIVEGVGLPQYAWQTENGF